MSYTFRQVFADHQGVEVPMLQRDYAQGRPNAGEVRSRFLKALHDTLLLPDGDPKLPLDLDFVYGSKKDGVFRPLDGQQRLTTLFLLHWYLALRDEQSEDFRAFVVDGKRSRFSYQVRPSSRDFFDALVAADVDLDNLFPPDPDCDNALSKTLKDAVWFYQSWLLDPTICSCLEVLDAIHTRFLSSRGLYQRLSRAERPTITFQFLNLEEFKLTDDLYIKMNARGKPLTLLEAFKANLEQYIAEKLPGERVGEIPLKDHVSHRFDTQWCDLFWRHRDEDNAHDNQMMNAIRAVALVALPPHKSNSSTLSALTDAKLRSFYDYEGVGCVHEGFIRALIRLFDRWSEGGGDLTRFLASADYYDEAGTFVRILVDKGRGPGSMTYARWVQFVAWSAFLLTDRPLTELREWMRVLTNLARNTTYNRVEEFRSSLMSIQALLHDRDVPLLDHFADTGAEVVGFNRQQIREERLKAQLLLKNSAWRPLIERAETHVYFRGQIEFLFDFSEVLSTWLPDQRSDWSEEKDDELRRSFAQWLDRAVAVFPAGGGPRGAGLADIPEFLWERALLCEGNYLLPKGMNHSFLDDTDRELSWKRLLRSDLDNPDLDAKRAIVGRVLARVDPGDINGSLQRRVDEGVTSPSVDFSGWRQRLVDYPWLIGLCHIRRQLRFVPGETVYLLHRIQRNGRHWDLYTAHLFKVVEPLLKTGGLPPFEKSTLDPVKTDAVQPALILNAAEPDGQLHITFGNGVFYLLSSGFEADVGLTATPKNVVQRLHEVAEHLRGDVQEE